MVIGAVEGTSAEIQTASDQLDRFFEAQPHAVLAGSLGRAAMYGQFGYDAPPVSLSKPDSWNGLRDFDVLFVDPSLYDGKDDVKLGLRPHEVDGALGSYLGQMIDGRGVLCATDVNYHRTYHLLRPEVIRRVKRPFLNTRVWTLPVGTQRLVERLVHQQGGRLSQYVASTTVFDAFAEHIRGAAPDEFLPIEYYAPFAHYFARNRH